MIAALQVVLADSALFRQVEGLRRFLDPAFFLPHLLRIGLVFLFAFVAHRLVRASIRSLLSREIDEEDPVVKRLREQRARTFASLFGNFALVLIIVITLLTVLASIGVQLGPILASVGVLGLAVSFGAQSLVKDVIAGTFILLEGQFGLGDVIRIGDVGGVVEKITLRTVALRDVHGIVHIIPNGSIDRVSNLTKSWSRAVLDIGVAYKEDVDRVMAVLRELGEEVYADPEWRPLLVDAPEVPGVESFGDSAVVVRFMVKTLPMQQWTVSRELRRRIKNRFDEENIEIPYPHVSFYWGDAQLPPALAQPINLGAADSHDATANRQH